MADIIEEYEDDGETVDIKNISYDYVILESIREIMKLSRNDLTNQLTDRNRLLNALDFFDALLEPIEDDQYHQTKNKQNPKEYFRNMMALLKRGRFIALRRGEVI